MNINELQYLIKFGMIKDLIPVKKMFQNKINNNLNIKKASYKEFKKYLPDKIINFLYYSPLSNIIYYDGEFILFETNIYVEKGKLIYLKTNPEDSCFNSINLRISIIENAKRNKLYFNIYNFIPERYKMEVVINTINKIPKEYRYNVFMYYYIRSDFSSKIISDELFINIVSCKTDEEKIRTSDQISSLPEKIMVFRGSGSKSNKKGFSYTLSRQTANVFAFYYYKPDSEENAYVITGVINKKDIIEYSDNLMENEVEIICRPQDVKIIRKQKFIPLFMMDNLRNSYMDMINVYIDPRLFDMNNEKKEHGIYHAKRVLFWSICLADYYKIQKIEKSILIQAAIYHDIGRSHDYEDEIHGKESYYKLINYNNAKYDNEILRKLIEFHCLPDNECNDKVFGIEILLLKILKDADALDRMRFGIRELNPDYLRLKKSKELLLAAYQLTFFKI